jgi:Extensin-like protein C-terminus
VPRTQRGECGKISEHGRANALDVRALKLADGRTIGLTDERVAKSLRENLRQSACRRFTTVLGNGADAYHESHVHLDLLERSNKYRICQWDVLDVVESAALAKKAAIAANAVPERDVPLPRPRPAMKGDASNPPRRSREATRGAIFDLITPLLKHSR